MYHYECDVKDFSLKRDACAEEVMCGKHAGGRRTGIHFNNQRNFCVPILNRLVLFLDAEASLVESKWCFSHGQR